MAPPAASPHQPSHPSEPTPTMKPTSDQQLEIAQVRSREGRPAEMALDDIVRDTPTRLPRHVEWPDGRVTARGRGSPSGAADVQPQPESVDPAAIAQMPGQQAPAQAPVVTVLLALRDRRNAPGAALQAGGRWFEPSTAHSLLSQRALFDIASLGLGGCASPDHGSRGQRSRRVCARRAGAVGAVFAGARGTTRKVGRAEADWLDGLRCVPGVARGSGSDGHAADL